MRGVRMFLKTPQNGLDGLSLASIENCSDLRNQPDSSALAMEGGSQQARDYSATPTTSDEQDWEPGSTIRQKLGSRNRAERSCG